MLNDAPRRLVLFNPNTSSASTQAMLAIARMAAPGVAIEGATGAVGVPLITTPEEAAVGADATRAFCTNLDARRIAGVVISAFADPGLADARALLGVPVVGIAEAAMLEAASVGRFSIAMTTPALAAMTADLARAYDCGAALASVRTIDGDPLAAMGDPHRLDALLMQLCREAIEQDGAAAVIIGGGPLAPAARRLAGRISVPLIEPVPAAIRRILVLVKT